MGRRRAKKKAGKRGASAPPPRSFPPPPLPGSSTDDILEWLGHGGIILVLFETPSGFALLRYDGVRLFRGESLKDIWIKFTEKKRAQYVVYLIEFQKFEDKSTAISLESGVSDQLVQMFKKWHYPGQKLAVGRSDYKEIIQAKSGIHCLYDEPVMELMWGLNNLMKSLVPGETCELARDDRCHMSKGMQLILNKYGFKVEPEMVDDNLMEIAVVLYESDYCVNKHTEYLHYFGECLKDISDINFRDWDLQKLSTALKLICHPSEEIETGNSDEMISEDMANRLVADAPKCEAHLSKHSCLGIYRQIKFARSMSEALALLKSSQAQEIATGTEKMKSELLQLRA